MRLYAMLAVFVVVLSSCNDGKVYQEYVDFEKRYWLVNDTVRFSFAISDTTTRYNVYCNLRNTTQYPYSRFFVNVAMSDTVGTPIHSALLNDFLFDPKTGEPLGNSGLGDLYDHQMPLLKNYRFARPGEFRVDLLQMNRVDTLDGIISVGLAIEKVK
jgi:gliding motility-associated lipoprotein GldH